ncbi:MAG TPA: flagellar hook-length control protein FliK [Steroidobacteraceae bacterium]|nr:flagellar hook-length control protein FliK [Steroidobacteraceae bacterium]
MRLELATSRPATAAASSNLLAQWRVGSIVEAIASRDSSDGKLWLNIGGTRVPARIASGEIAGPADGERLQLRVLRDHPVLAMETLQQADTETTVVSDALRRFLPRQASPAPLLANVATIAKQPASPAQAAPINRAVREAVQRLWLALPDAVELQTPEGLAKAVQRSGAFLESNLSAADPTDVRQVIARDLKALLLNLKQTLVRNGASPQAIDSPPPGPLPTLRGPLLPLPQAAANLHTIDSPLRQLNELAAQTDNALARTNTVQLVNSEASNVAAAWLVEVPLRRDNDPETIRFRFERHSTHESAEQSWTVEAALDLGSRGALHARISMYGKRIGVQFRAEPATLVADLSTQAPLLSSMLRDAGLDVDRVVCLHGMPAEDRDQHATTLLDIRV